MNAAMDTVHLGQRHIRALLRQPWWIAVTLVQPIIWLVLFGKLFETVVDIPGFQPAGADYSFIDFLTPGVIVMTAFFSAGWGGMTMIEDLDRGVVDRFLVSPANRSAIILGRLLQASLSIVIQSIIIIVLALIMGADFPNGVGGVVILIVISAIVGFGFGALSNGLALLIRREESLIAMMQFLLLPLTFISSTIMNVSLAPQWIQTLAKFNPVNWAVEAGRSAAIDASPDWSLIGSRTAYLIAFGVVMAIFATRAFRSYQRTV